MMTKESPTGSPIFQPDPIRMQFPGYLNAFKAKLKHVYHDRSDVHAMALQRGTQLFGAQAYKLDHIAGRGITDSQFPHSYVFTRDGDVLY